MQTENKSFFLFLGDCDRESATSKLKAAGAEYKKKRLESRLENWESIFKYLDQEDLSGVLVKLNSITYRLMVLPEYAAATSRLFSTLKHLPHIVFVHETLITGIATPPPSSDTDEENHYFYTTHYFELPEPNVLNHVNDLIEQYELTLVPYQRNVELAVMASEFIDQNEKNLIFRLYVPTGKMWANEAGKLLQLFREYLGKVSGLHVRQDQYTTNQGVVYEFFGDHTLDPSTLPIEFDEFSKLLDMCMVNPSNATQMLMNKSVDSRAIQEIVERYAKEAKRLHVDLKHERERIVLSIRHRMESELIDVTGIEADWNEINKLVNASVPQLGGVSSAIGFGPSLSNNVPTNVTVNIRPQIISSVQGIVAQEVSGTQNFGVEAAQLIELIKLYGGSFATELTSAVYELEDADAKQADRLTARQKIKAFLFKSSEKIGGVALNVLQKYVESKLGL